MFIVQLTHSLHFRPKIKC